MKLKSSLQSALWVASTQGTQIVLRLLSSIILTRLLFPEAFGQILMVTTITSFIALISEVGFRGSVINNPRGESDSGYVNTIWTLMIFRSLIVAVVLLFLSEYSYLIYPNAPELRLFLKIAAITSVVKGFLSTKMYQHEKRMEMKHIAFIQLISQCSALIATVIFIQFEPSALSILWGETAAMVVLVSLSHLVLNGTRNSIGIDKTAISTISKYGRWILPATMMTWVLNNGHKFILALVLSASVLGFYALANNIAIIVRSFLNSFSDKWTFPMYAKLGEGSEMELTALKLRISIMLLAAIAIGVLGGASEFIVGLIYEARYADAAKLITLISIGSMGLVVSDCYVPIFKARADSYGLMRVRVIQAVILVASLYVGYQVSGAEGILIGTSAAHLVNGILTAWLARKHFKHRVYLFDSAIITIPFIIWLYFERDTLNSMFIL